MKIIPLVENNLFEDDTLNEHGLSIYIETENYKVLFDTGKTDLFLKNAERLNANLQEVDIVIISHGHYDHIGGLMHFLEINKKAKVYLKSEIFENDYFSIRKKNKKYIGFNKELLNHFDRFIFVNEKDIRIDELNIISTIENNYPLPKGNNILFKEKNNILENDDFKHELIFTINTENGLIIFSGCAHNGILNTITTVKNKFPKEQIKTLIGGFHLIDKNEFTEVENTEEITNIGKELEKMFPNVIFYTGHCTGQNTFVILQNILKIHKIKYLNYE